MVVHVDAEAGLAGHRAVGAGAVGERAARAQRPATQNRIAIFHPVIPTTHLTESGGEDMPSTATRADEVIE